MSKNKNRFSLNPFKPNGTPMMQCRSKKIGRLLLEALHYNHAHEWNVKVYREDSHREITVSLGYIELNALLRRK